MVAVVIFFAVAGIAVGIQYFLFRSVAAVVVAILVGAVWAYFLTRTAVADFASRIRTHLDVVALGAAGQSRGTLPDLNA